jgi:replicative superfamily II helicase
VKDEYWLAAGMTEKQILDDYPELDSDDFLAVYEFAARLAGGSQVGAGRCRQSRELVFRAFSSGKIEVICCRETG